MIINIKYTLVILTIFVVLFNLYTSYALASDPLISAVNTSASALDAQSERLKIIAQNIANEDSTAIDANNLPYQRKTIHMKAKKNRRNKGQVVISKYGRDQTPFKKKYDPSHPYASSDGYVLLPNVDKAIEVVDAKEAQRSYEANLSTIEVTKSMINKTLEMMK